jgi:hypothetical protein
MTIEADIKEIKERILQEGDIVRELTDKRYIAKIQKAGIFQNKQRYSIYITKPCKDNELTEGDIVEITIKKIGHKAKVIRNKSFNAKPINNDLQGDTVSNAVVYKQNPAEQPETAPNAEIQATENAPKGV